MLFALAYFACLGVMNASCSPTGTFSSGPSSETNKKIYSPLVVTIPPAGESISPRTVQVGNDADVPAPPYMLNVRVVIERDASGNLARDAVKMQQDFNVAAQLYRSIHLSFAITEVEIVDVASHEPSMRDYWADALMHSDSMTVYYIFGHPWLTPGGLATFPWEEDRLGLFINGQHTGHFTLAHEIGHYFGLYHTFDEGTRNGDFVRDTIDQADWNEEERGPYSGYDNLMNYSNGTTRHLTSGQLERVRHFLTTHRKHQLLVRSGDYGAIELRIDETSVTLPNTNPPGPVGPVSLSQGDGE